MAAVWCFLAVWALLPWATIATARAQEGAPVAVAMPERTEGTAPLRLTGTITPARFAALSPRVDGLVVTANAEEGHVAQEGDVLVMLDTTLAELRLAESRARLVEAHAQHADALRLREEAERLGQNIAQSTLQSRITAVQASTAVVSRLRAELQYQTELVARHAVLAPFDGVVIEKLTEIGEWAETGRPVLELLATDHLRLDLRAPQAYYPTIRRVTVAAVRVDALPEHRFTARVVAVVPASDPEARTFLVRLLLDNPASEIIAGMSAEAVFSIGDGEAAVAIPRDAVIRYPDGSTSVWVVEGDRAHERQVTLGRAIGETVTVTAGLDGTLPVVVRGNETLAEGAVVRAVEQVAEGAPH
jgi:RND family efflux transporter MFP subunit